MFNLLRSSRRRALCSWTLLLGAAAGIATATPPPGSLIQVTGGSPFTDCTADGIEQQPGNVFIGSEIEPWIVVNPTDRDNLVTAWQQDRWSNGSARGLAVATSFDGGETWQQVPLPGLTLCSGGPFLRATDPWLSFAPDGTLFHMALGVDGRIGRSAMLVQKSTDGGLSWSEPITLVDDLFPLFNDKNTLTADPTDSRFVYATWDRLDFANGGGPALLARSTDGGESFEPVSVVYDPGPAAQTIGAQIVVLPDGTVLNFFSDVIFLPTAPFFQLTISLKYSIDKGASWLPSGDPIPVSVIQSTFAVVDPETATPVRDANIIFDVAVDPKDGTLYTVWQDARFNNGQHDAIALSVSTDGGFTWSSPVQINQTPDNLPLLQKQAFVPSVHVDRKGRVAVTYYDFRNEDADPTALTDHWAITCRPKNRRGCEQPANWSGEIRLTEESFDLLQAPFAGGLFLGDYVGLASTPNDFVALFAQTHDDDPASLFVRRFDKGPKRRNVPPGKSRGALTTPEAQSLEERKLEGLRRVMKRLHQPEPSDLQLRQ